MIRILIVEDTEVVGLMLRSIFGAQRDMEVIGHARNGQQGVEMAKELKPDLITMDIRMPVMDGFEATRRIMADSPTPIVVVSASVKNSELRITFRAIEEGALAVIEKPRRLGPPGFDVMSRELVELVRTMAEVPVVRRGRFAHRPVEPIEIPAVARVRGVLPEVLAIGCSTGGPQALHAILPRIPASFPVPIAIVQHISPGFLGGLIDWLQKSCQLTLKQARHQEPLAAGTVYFAPDDRHLRIVRKAGRLVAMLDASPAVNKFRPSATPLFESVAHTCRDRAIGVLLTGMGEDGAVGLQAMHRAESHTVAQDEASSVVFGMPKAAIKLDAVDSVVPLQDIASYLTQAVVTGTHAVEVDGGT